MVYKCPQCGKIVELSDDELMSQGNLVVCPACLAEYAGRPDLPIAKHDEEKTYYYGGSQTPSAPTGAAAPVAPSAEYVYCRYCGSRLVKGCNFCSNCGKPLATTTPKPSQPTRPTIPQMPTDDSYSQSEASNQMPYMPSYRYASSRPNVPTKRKSAPILAYLVMVALIAIFILIVISDKIQ